MGGEGGRDWNEEFQLVKEMPRASLDDKIARDQALYRLQVFFETIRCILFSIPSFLSHQSPQNKYQADFVEETKKSARMILNRELSPLNPHESFGSQMFIRNKVFYCVIGENEIFREIGGAETAHVSSANDLKVFSLFISSPFLFFLSLRVFFSRESALSILRKWMAFTLWQQFCWTTVGTESPLKPLSLGFCNFNLTK